MRSWHTSLLVAAGALILSASGISHAANNQGSPSTTKGKATTQVVKTRAGAGMDCGIQVSISGKLPPGSGTIKVPGPGGVLPGPITGGSVQVPVPNGSMKLLAPGGLGFGMLTVTSVNGDTITGTSLKGASPITVTVGISTTYSEAGNSATLQDVHVGSHLLVCGSATDPNNIKASNVVIVLPQAQGVITAVNGAQLTVVGFDGSSRLVTTDGSTKVDRVGTTAAVSDLTVGTAIVATGNIQSDHSLLALSVSIQLPSVVGKVTAVNGNSITIDSGNIDGPAPAIVTSNSTTYDAKAPNSTATAASVTVGSYIVATGTESTDGTTMNALRVTVLQADAQGVGGQVQVGGFSIAGGSAGASFRIDSAGSADGLSVQGTAIGTSESVTVDKSGGAI